MLHAAARAVPLALAAALLGCAAAPAESPQADAEGVVTGQAFYRERIAPPTGGTVRVTLYNAAIADHREILDRQEIPIGGDSGGPPWEFRLTYDPAQIDAGLVYAVRAEVRDAAGRVRFRSRGRNEVITHGRPSRVEVMMTLAN